MKKILKYGMVGIISLVLLIVLGIFISRFWMYLVIELFQDTPLLIPMGMMFYVMLDLFTPNKKKFSVLWGVLILESMEHIVFPLAIIIGSILFNAFFSLILFPIVYLIFGKLLGEIKEKKDRIKIGVIYLLTLFLLTFPYIVWKINWFVPIDNAGFIFLAGLMFIIILGYIFYLHIIDQNKKAIISSIVLFCLWAMFGGLFSPW